MAQMSVSETEYGAMVSSQTASRYPVDEISMKVGRVEYIVSRSEVFRVYR